MMQHLSLLQDWIGLRASNSIVAMIYSKHSKISNATNKSFQSGEIVNFVEVDAERLFWLCYQLSEMVQVPIVLSLSFSFAFYFFGYVFFAGLGVFVVAGILFLFMAEYQSNQYEIYMRRKDRRMVTTTESINNIRMLKLYAW